jgi:hypothetical protein
VSQLTDTGPRNTIDGIGLYHDTGSLITELAVGPT